MKKDWIIKHFKNLPSTKKEQESLLEFLMSEADSLSPTHDFYHDIVTLIDKLNQNEFQHVGEWLNHVRLHPANRFAHVDNHTSNEESAATISDSDNSSNHEENERDSVVVSIIIGIIASILFTPFLGIIIGFIYFFNARKIHEILSCLGCGIFFLIIMQLL